MALAIAACSQRSPWRAVGAPEPTQQATALPAAVNPGAPATAAAPAPPAMDAALLAHIGSLYYPVAGMDSTRLDDSFEAPRDGGSRQHKAIDIMAPRGAAVLAVQDGRILRLSKSAKGGITAYATDLEEQFVYYYAHLDRYHARVYDGKPLMRGDTIGFVGTTGNSPPNLPHLHFQIMRMPSDRKSFWAGAPVNPFPLLRTTNPTQTGNR